MSEEALRLPPFQRGSETSREAALSVYYAAPGQRGRVLRLLAERGPLTDETAAATLRMSPNSYRPRRVELVSDGLVERDPVDGRTASGRKAARWAVRRDPEQLRIT